MARCSSLLFRCGLLLAVFAFLVACKPYREFPIVKERVIEYGNARLAGSVAIRVPQLWVDGRDTPEAAVFTVPLGIFKTGQVNSIREGRIEATPAASGEPGMYQVDFDFAGIPRDEYEIRVLKEVPFYYFGEEGPWDSSALKVLFTSAKYKLTRSDPERLDIAETWNLTSATDNGEVSGTVLIDGYNKPDLGLRCQPIGSGWALPLYWVSRMDDDQHGRVEYSLRGLPYAEYEIPMSGTYGLNGRAIADMPNPVLSSANPEAQNVDLNVIGYTYVQYFGWPEEIEGVVGEPGHIVLDFTVPHREYKGDLVITVTSTVESESLYSGCRRFLLDYRFDAELSGSMDLPNLDSGLLYNVTAYLVGSGADQPIKVADLGQDVAMAAELIEMNGVLREIQNGLPVARVELNIREENLPRK